MDVLIHRLHKELGGGFAAVEINDCEICHTGGTPTKNFPVVATPNPVPICDASGRGITTINWASDTGLDIRMGSKTGTLFARTSGEGSKDTGKWVKEGQEFVVLDRDSGDVIQELHVNATVFGCSGNAPYAFSGTPGAQHTNWLDHPSRMVCGSCHTDVNFATGEGHSTGIAQADDENCDFCHQPDSGREYDASIRGAHQVLFQSSQLTGVILEFIDVTDTDPGDKPTVTFSLLGQSGRLDPADVDRVRFTITGPNEDFSYYNQETVGAKARPVGDYWAYTFETPLPKTAMGSYTVSVEGRHDRPIDMGDDGVEEEHDTIEATLMAFAVTDAVAVPRRMVVSDEKCEICHRNLEAHGGGRTNMDYCNTCHAPQAVAQLEPQESYAMKFMTHKIHRGEDLENGYVVVRSRGTYDFSHVEFPGDLRNCEKCHINDSYELPLPAGLLATPTPKNWWSPMQPIAAACLSCHDGDDAAAHAFSNATFFGEACGACHGEGMDYAVSKVHAR
jgi:OmcA/MtrC family decaheme c-type cytochrome